ncbi:hypothetical protein ACHAW6_004038 [Cyclotella cf. meneghiniana]
MTDQSSAQTLKAKQACEQLGLNLDPSPQHVRNVNLVLNLDTGLVSLQFNCWYNDIFETISFNKPEIMMSSNWQVLAGLEKPDKTPTVKQVLQRTQPSQPIAHDTNLLVPNQDPAQVPDELSSSTLMMSLPNLILTSSGIPLQ